MNHHSEYKERLTPILDSIRRYDRIFIFRHLRMDGDCVGASKGLKGIIQATWPEKEVYLTDGQTSDYLAFAGPDDEDVAEEKYAGALGIVVDTASKARISNPKFALCRELIKIDHHIELEPYGDLQWVEEERSSVCEMIAVFYDTFRDELKLTREAATHIYMGMVTDSGGFRYQGVTGDTLRCAALLLDLGIDTERLYAHLYSKDYESLKFRAYVYQHMCRTEHGVAYFHVSKAIQEEFGLTLESASAAISYLDSIKGCLCWLAFIDNGDEQGSIRVRLRSRFVAINQVAERFHGGGHACASGATVYSMEEAQRLVEDADEVVRAYQQTHEGWL